MEIVLKLFRQWYVTGYKKMTKLASLELNEKFYSEHVWLSFISLLMQL